MNSEAMLFTDGGGEKEGAAGAACIIRHSGGEKRLVMVLGGATNNEAEISACLLGLNYLRQNTSVKSVNWVADSEYALKSASSYIYNWQKNGWKTASKQPVKNQGLWKLYLHLSSRFEMHFTHVKGHAGHPENEACDAASTWARNNGHEVSGVAQLEGESWDVVDGREFIVSLREEDISPEVAVSKLQSRPASAVYLEKALEQAKVEGNKKLVEGIEKLLK